MRRVMIAAAILAALCAPSIKTAAAQGWPERSVRLVVPYPPGGFNDTLGRIVAQKPTEAWGQPAAKVE